MAYGVDYAWTHPPVSSLKTAGVRFVMRYLSHDASKNLSRSEADSLASAGIWSGVVWETTANRAGAGRAAGTADARDAAAGATACGMPSSRPVYFAVDYDADPAEVAPYFQGVASVLGLNRTGVYGGYRVVKYLLDHGLARWAWQTRAWSAGRWDDRAHIRQGAYVTIGGIQCDANTSMKTDFGQWMPGRTPEADVALTTDDVNKVAAAVWSADVIPAARPPHANDDYAKNPTWSAKYAMQAAVEAARTACDPAPVALTLTDAQVAQLAAALCSSPGLADLIAAKVGDNLAARLES